MSAGFSDTKPDSNVFRPTPTMESTFSDIILMAIIGICRALGPMHRQAHLI